jgi:radical SAM-linked protein
MRTVERSVRRAELPFVLTAGKSPHLKIAYGPPLPVGFCSQSEFLDLDLTVMVPLKDLIKSLGLGFPKGLAVAEARYMPPHPPSLSSQTVAAGYRLRAEVIEDLRDKKIENDLKDFLAQDELFYEHKGTPKKIALREAVLSLALDSFRPPELVLTMTLSCGSATNIRPEYVLPALAFSRRIKVKEICRTGLYAWRGAKLLDLISL